MNPNETYMIPGCFSPDIPRKAEQPKPTPQPKTYKKYWGAVICKEGQREDKTKPDNKILALKIRTERELLKSSFEAASFRLQEDLLLQTPEQLGTMGKVLIQQHLDNLWLKNARSYVRLCVFEFAEALCGFANSNTAKGARNGALGEAFSAMVLDTINVYYKQREKLEQNLLELLQNIRTGKDWGAKMTKRFLSAEAALEDASHRRKISAALSGIILSGQDKYTYVCTEEADTCEACSVLDGQVFDVDKAVEGVNLPPMHPNCRCSIAGYPEQASRVVPQELLKPLLAQATEPTIERILGKLDDKLTRFFNGLGVLWSALFEESAIGAYKSFHTVAIGGKQYRINLESFQAVAIGPDGNYIVPENVSPENDRLLQIMQERDSYPEGSAKHALLHNEALTLYATIPLSERNVDPNKEYSFYIFGGDVTQRLNDYMAQAKVDYAHMHERHWFENLGEFKALVQNRGEMDLKNRLGWQKSAYVYDGELVAQDALGNINYGHFGTFCNIPKVVLIYAAGLAQLLAHREVNEEFWRSGFDDQRDTYRVLQGIKLYNAWN